MSRVLDVSPPCPLCQGADRLIADVMTTTEILSAWRHMGVILSSEALSVFQEWTNVCLFHCKACGFEFCDPALAGNDAFYQDLQRQAENYYPEDCPSFRRAVRFALGKKLTSVLDVGCGCGAFLNLARRAGLRTSGIELNRQARAMCSAEGHRVYGCLLADFERDGSSERFDLVCAFEILEHVPDPLRFLAEAARRVKPDGYLAIAVPHRDGLHRVCMMEPHQWPPHHITRWRLTDLKRIGKLCGLRTVRAGGDVLIGGEIQHFLNLRQGLLTALGRTPSPWPFKLYRLLTLFYRKTGCKYFFPRLGPGIYAFYQKDASCQL